MSHRPADPSFARFRTRASRLPGRTDLPRPVVSPHRFDPLGAHVDHDEPDVEAMEEDREEGAGGSAAHLSDPPTIEELRRLPCCSGVSRELADTPGRRARHVVGEVQRVQIGSDAWSHGDRRFFGELTNASCESSITGCESGGEWPIALQEIACGLPGVFGGGFGGCLVVLVERDAVQPVAAPERGVRIE